MPERFALTFKDLERDIERHAERFGAKGSIMGTPAVFGWDQSKRSVFDAYVGAGADDAIVAWLMQHWNYCYGTNPYFEETIERFVAAGARSRVSRLWRHVCAEQMENYRIVSAHRDLSGMGKQISQSRKRVLESMREWRRCLLRLGDDDAVRHLDQEITDFEADYRKPVRRKPDPRRIDQDLFWEIVGTAGETTGSTSDRVREISDRLAEFSASQIKAFEKLLWGAMQRLNHYDAWALAYLLNDGCSDDAFEAFRAWIILQGRDAFDLVLSDPVAFLNQIGVWGNMDGSALLHVSAIAYDRRTGKALPTTKRLPAAVQGTPWNEETVEQTYPLMASWIAAKKDGL